MTGGIGFSKLGQMLHRNNRNMLNHTFSVKSKRDKLVYRATPKNLKYKKPSLKGLQSIREKAIRDHRKDLVKTIILIILLLIILGIVGWSVY